MLLIILKMTYDSFEIYFFVQVIIHVLIIICIKNIIIILMLLLINIVKNILPKFINNKYEYTNFLLDEKRYPNQKECNYK